ncbi:TPA: hypothetical protein N7840_005022 [Escherichia coli]|nr:hypothetical protein [Escherichia coli]EIX2805235.1 hypothetical protein [Escherichia coli]EKI6895990.1 hypothetical protein [Escherichia coli]EME3720840.1 hypothetical protein [Escherichia coli]MCQ6683657.1 hypothetical protein [Escherichia coli]HBB9176462.1 hypothetical protein [Escherichia coli]
MHTTSFHYKYHAQDSCLHPAVFCRDAGSAGHGATEAARPERSLQARGFHASDRSDSPKPRQRVRRRLAGAPAAACRSRA